MENELKKWAMPEWMEKYRDLINNTGGNEVEDLINRLKTDKNISRTNIIIFTMATCVEAQVGLLATLKRKDLLK